MPPLSIQLKKTKHGWFFWVLGSHQGSLKEVFFFLSGDLFFLELASLKVIYYINIAPEKCMVGRCMCPFGARPIFSDFFFGFREGTVTSNIGDKIFEVILNYGGC